VSGIVPVLLLVYTKILSAAATAAGVKLFLHNLKNVHFKSIYKAKSGKTPDRENEEFQNRHCREFPLLRCWSSTIKI
jgi:hypothetical protein